MAAKIAWIEESLNNNLEWKIQYLPRKKEDKTRPNNYRDKKLGKTEEKKMAQVPEVPINLKNVRNQEPEIAECIPIELEKRCRIYSMMTEPASDTAIGSHGTP